jgi:hypothetical protein
VVRQSGGVIRAESMPEEGSVFRVFLPQRRAVSQKPAAARVINALFGKR